MFDLGRGGGRCFQVKWQQDADTQPWCPTVYPRGQDSFASPALGQAGSFDGNELWESDQCQMCRFLLSKAGGCGWHLHYQHHLHCWHMPNLGSGGAGSGGADSPRGMGGCAFLPHTQKSDLPQLIERILLPWCTAVQTTIYYLFLHYPFSRSALLTPLCGSASALPVSGSGFCSRSCLL